MQTLRTHLRLGGSLPLSQGYPSVLDWGGAGARTGPQGLHGGGERREGRDGPSTVYRLGKAGTAYLPLARQLPAYQAALRAKEPLRSRGSRGSGRTSSAEGGLGGLRWQELPSG